MERSPEFRRELLRSALECLHAGDLQTAKAVLRSYVNGSVGFEALGKALDRSPKSLMRMLSIDGNPQMSSLFEITGYLQQHEGVRVVVTLDPVRKRRKAA